MIETFAGMCLLLGMSSLLYFYWARVRVRHLSRLRLEEVDDAPEEILLPLRIRPFFRRHWLLPWLIAAGAALGLWLLTPVPPLFIAVAGLLIGLLGSLLEAFRLERLTLRIEEQLADAIDLMVAALQSGVGVMNALDSATQESRWPLKRPLEETFARIRYGDDPLTVFRDLEKRVPLETFRLYSAALSTHWETGGSLAPTLATVGKVIRDRIDVKRRIETQATQAKFSTVVVMLVTYFIGVMIWRNDPERMEKFLSSLFGQVIVAGAVLLQAIGIIWTAALSRLKY